MSALLVTIEQQLRRRGRGATSVSSSSATEEKRRGCESVSLARSLRVSCAVRSLARAYANMDAFVFPSHTDTFGNVVLEALASGVPAIVTPDGGPARIVRDGETGFIRADSDFAAAIADLAADATTYAAMRERARQYALSASWDAVFEERLRAIRDCAERTMRRRGSSIFSELTCATAPVRYTPRMAAG